MPLNFIRELVLSLLDNYNSSDGEYSSSSEYYHNGSITGSGGILRLCRSLGSNNGSIGSYRSIGSGSLSCGSLGNYRSLGSGSLGNYGSSCESAVDNVGIVNANVLESLVSCSGLSVVCILVNGYGTGTAVSNGSVEKLSLYKTGKIATVKVYGKLAVEYGVSGLNCNELICKLDTIKNVDGDISCASVTSIVSNVRTSNKRIHLTALEIHNDLSVRAVGTLTGRTVYITVAIMTGCSGNGTHKRTTVDIDGHISIEGRHRISVTAADICPSTGVNFNVNVIGEGGGGSRLILCNAALGVTTYKDNGITFSESGRLKRGYFNALANCKAIILQSKNGIVIKDFDIKVLNGSIAVKVNCCTVAIIENEFCALSLIIGSGINAGKNEGCIVSGKNVLCIGNSGLACENDNYLGSTGKGVSYFNSLVNGSNCGSSGLTIVGVSAGSTVKVNNNIVSSNRAISITPVNSRVTKAVR